jgi:hypothetical protein
MGVVAANSGQWWRSASDGSRKVNVEQKQKKMEKAADGRTAANGGVTAGAVSGSNSGSSGIKRQGGGIINP